MKFERFEVFALSCFLCACGPRVGESGEGGGDAGAQDVGSEEFDVEWAMGFYYRDDRLIGGQIGYIEIKDGGVGVWHRIQCDFSPVEPWPFRWRPLSDTEVELYPVEGEEDLPTLGGGVRASEILRRKSPESSDALVESGVAGAEAVTYSTGRPCNVPPPKEGCPEVGFSRLDEIPICDER